MKFLIVCILLIYIYYKIRHPFWSKQPVFHYHNLIYWVSPPGIIYHDIPERGKYFSYDIDFHTFDQMKDEQKNDFYDLISNHYLRNKHESYEPTKESIMPYFEKHNNISTITLYYKNKLLISSMTMRPLKFNDSHLYYVDFLCVHKDYRRKGIAPEIIYTHYVRNREEHPNKIFLFKREGELTSIVPLTSYETYCFNISRPRKVFHPEIKNERIKKENIKFLYHFLSASKHKFIYFIVPDYSHLLHLIDKRILKIFVASYKNEPFGCYVFRDAHTKYEGKNSIELVASCYLKEKDLFEKYFFDGIRQMKTKVVLIENISNNSIIIQNILRKQKYTFKSKAAYFLYNYATRPVTSEKIFIVN